MPTLPGDPNAGAVNGPEKHVLIFGYVGNSSDQDTTRILLDPSFRTFIDVFTNDITHTVTLHQSQAPLAGTYFWIKETAYKISVYSNALAKNFSFPTSDCHSLDCPVHTLDGCPIPSQNINCIPSEQGGCAPSTFACPPPESQNCPPSDDGECSHQRRHPWTAMPFLYPSVVCPSLNCGPLR